MLKDTKTFKISILSNNLDDSDIHKDYVFICVSDVVISTSHVSRIVLEGVVSGIRKIGD